MKVLKTMLRDITPKSWKATWDGILLTVILLAILSVGGVIVSAIAMGVAYTLSLPIDVALLVVICSLGLVAWAYDAYERSRQ